MQGEKLCTSSSMLKNENNEAGENSIQIGENFTKQKFVRKSIQPYRTTLILSSGLGRITPKTLKRQHTVIVSGQKNLDTPQINEITKILVKDVKYDQRTFAEVEKLIITQNKNKLKTVKQGEAIFSLGDIQSNVYLILKGKVDIYKAKKGNQAEQLQQMKDFLEINKLKHVNKIMEFTQKFEFEKVDTQGYRETVSDVSPSGLFKPGDRRQACAIAQTDCELLVIMNNDYQRVMHSVKDLKMQKYVAFLLHTLLEGYNEDFVWSLVKYLKKEKAKNGKLIFEQGHPSNCFYILFRGRVTFSLKMLKGKNGPFIHLPMFVVSEGECFGEQDFLQARNRKVSCLVSSNKAAFFVIDRAIFHFIQQNKPLFAQQISKLSRQKDKLFDEREASLLASYQEDIKMQLVPIKQNQNNILTKGQSSQLPNVDKMTEMMEQAKRRQALKAKLKSYRQRQRRVRRRGGGSEVTCKRSIIELAGKVQIYKNFNLFKNEKGSQNEDNQEFEDEQNKEDISNQDEEFNRTVKEYSRLQSLFTKDDIGTDNLQDPNVFLKQQKNKQKQEAFLQQNQMQNQSQRQNQNQNQLLRVVEVKNVIRGKIIKQNGNSKATESALGLKMSEQQVVRCNQRVIKKLFPGLNKPIIQEEDPFAFASIKAENETEVIRRRLKEDYSQQRMKYQKSMQLQSQKTQSQLMQYQSQSQSQSQQQSQQQSQSNDLTINSTLSAIFPESQHTSVREVKNSSKHHIGHSQSQNVDNRNWTLNIHLQKNKNPIKYVHDMQNEILKHKVGPQKKQAINLNLQNIKLDKIQNTSQLPIQIQDYQSQLLQEQILTNQIGNRNNSFTFKQQKQKAQQMISSLKANQKEFQSMQLQQAYAFIDKYNLTSSTISKLDTNTINNQITNQMVINNENYLN